MCHVTRTILLASLVFLRADSPLAQPAAGASGHWEGTIDTPEVSMSVEIDLAKNTGGVFAGTFGEPARGVKGLPLSTVVVEGRSVRFIVKGGPDPATFEGVLAADGTSMSGVVGQGSYSLPFKLTRTGEARIAEAPRSAPIGRELEGVWNGTLDAGGRAMRITVRMANQPDGTAAGTVVSADGSGVEIPIAIAQNGSAVTIEVPSVSASYVAELNAARTELAGTWRQGQSSLPLTLKR